MMVAYNILSHQRGSGLLSSRIPSHSWPVVAIPVLASTTLPSPSLMLTSDRGSISVLPQRHASGLVEPPFEGRPQRVGHADDEDHQEIDEPPRLSEFGEHLVGVGHGSIPHRILAWSS